MLNESQQRAVAIALRMVERDVDAIERLLNSGGDSGILYEIRDDVSPEAKEDIFKLMSLIRVRIKVLAERFNLQRESIEASRKAFSRLSYLWEVLEETTAKKLGRYGDVAAGLENVLDPEVNAVIALIVELENILRRTNP